MPYEIFALFLPQSIVRRYRSCVVCRSVRSRILLTVVILNIIFVLTLYGKGSSTSHKSLNSHGPANGLKVYQAVTANDTVETLDTLDIQKVLKQFIVLPSDHCGNFARNQPEVNMIEPRQWQIVVHGVPKTFVFSAYYDARLQPPVVKIIGISSGFYGGPSSPRKYCQLWFRERSSPIVSHH